MVEPIFEKASFEITAGKPATFTQASEGSGKRVSINFCAACGTKLYLDLERFPAIYGIYGGTFDDPNWFDRSPKMTLPVSVRFASTQYSTTERQWHRPSSRSTIRFEQAVSR